MYADVQVGIYACQNVTEVLQRSRALGRVNLGCRVAAVLVCQGLVCVPAACFFLGTTLAFMFNM